MLYKQPHDVVAMYCVFYSITLCFLFDLHLKTTLFRTVVSYSSAKFIGNNIYRAKPRYYGHVAANIGHPTPDVRRENAPARAAGKYVSFISRRVLGWRSARERLRGPRTRVFEEMPPSRSLVYPTHVHRGPAHGAPV